MPKGLYQKILSRPAEEFGRGSTNPPTVVTKDCALVYAFTPDKDELFWSFPVPIDFDNGDLEFGIVWTNDGGVDDKGKRVKWELSYRVGADRDSIAGYHKNSPKTVIDRYRRKKGWIEQHADWITIQEKDFNIAKGQVVCINLRLRALSVGNPLTCEPHFVGMCIRYIAKSTRVAGDIKYRTEIHNYTSRIKSVDVDVAGMTESNEKSSIELTMKLLNEKVRQLARWEIDIFKDDKFVEQIVHDAGSVAATFIKTYHFKAPHEGGEDYIIKVSVYSSL